MTNKIQKGNVVFHEIVNAREENYQEGIKLFEQLEKLFKASGINTFNLDKARTTFIYGR